MALETHRTRKPDSSGHVPLTRNIPPSIRGQGGCPISSHPGALHTVSISKRNWCYMLVLLFRGGREEGRVSQGDPPFLETPLLRWCTPLLGSPTSPAHQEPSPDASHWYPSAESLDAGFDETIPLSSGPLALSPSTSSYFPHLGHLGVGRLPTLGIAPLFLWNPPTPPIHQSIHPSIPTA